MKKNTVGALIALIGPGIIVSYWISEPAGCALILYQTWQLILAQLYGSRP